MKERRSIKAREVCALDGVIIRGEPLTEVASVSTRTDAVTKEEITTIRFVEGGVFPSRTIELPADEIVEIIA